MVNGTKKFFKQYFYEGTTTEKMNAIPSSRKSRPYVSNSGVGLYMRKGK